MGLQEEEEWQEVLAQQDTWQQAAVPSGPEIQPQAQPASRNPHSPAAHAAGASSHALAVATVDDVYRSTAAPETDGHEAQTDFTDALVPAGSAQAASSLVGTQLPLTSRR